MWLGLVFEESKFKWLSTRNDLTFTNWRTGEPNNKTNDDQPHGENCVIMNFNSGLWVDVPCTFQKATICEKKLTRSG